MKRYPFTLLEIVSAMAIIIILAGMILGASSAAKRISRKRDALAHIRALEIVLEQYKADWGFYPESPNVRELGTWNDWYYLHLRKPPSPPTQPVDQRTIYIDLFDGNFKTEIDEAAAASPPSLIPATPAYHNYFLSPAGDPLRIIDSYHNAFYYQYPGTMNSSKFDLWSAGQDGEHGNAGVDDNGDGTTDNAGDAQSMNAADSDDVTNWRKH